MPILALISGFVRGIEETNGRSGKAYVSASLKIAIGRRTEFVTLFIFDELAAAEVIELRDGDPLAVTGNLKAQIYDGGISLSMFVESVMALKEPHNSMPLSSPKPDDGERG